MGQGRREEPIIRRAQAHRPNPNPFSRKMDCELNYRTLSAKSGPVERPRRHSYSPSLPRVAEREGLESDAPPSPSDPTPRSKSSLGFSLRWDPPIPSLSLSRYASRAMTPAITLTLPPRIYCAGSWVKGEVVLDLRQASKDKLEDVTIKLMGSADTYTKLDGDTSDEHEQRMITETTLILWTRKHGATRPMQAPRGDSTTLRLPFRLLLPENLPPTFYYDHRVLAASVLYSFSVVGSRPGPFRFNRRVKAPLAILPKDAPGARVGPGREWRKAGAVEKKVRKGLWGEYSTVRVELSLQDIPGGVRLFTRIPFAIDITTTSAPLTRAQAKVDNVHSDKAVFPVPPTDYTQLTFKLVRKVQVHAKSQSARATYDAVHFFGGPGHASASTATSTGKSSSSASIGAGLVSSCMDTHVSTNIRKKEWVAVEGKRTQPGGRPADDQGSWVQRVRFQSAMRLNVPPSFKYDTVECEDTVYLKVPFPGIGNDVKLEVPVCIMSGLDAPLSREQPPSPLDDEYSLSESHELTLDLPPDYWDSNIRK